jgi:hypothetical protein
MASRFRLPASGTPIDGITPAVQSYTHAGTTRRRLAEFDSSALATEAVTPDGADHGGAGDTLHAQFVSDPMAAGIAFVTSDTVSYALQGLEPSANNNLFIQLWVGVYSEDGSTLRAELLSKSLDGTELGTVLAARLSSHNLTAGYTTVAGDRLVVEFSVQGSPGGGGGVQGHNASLRWGNNGTSGDIVNEDETGTGFNPWIEFSRDITILPHERWVNTDNAGSVDGLSEATGYTSLSSWEANEASNRAHIVHCSGAAADTTSVSISGFGFVAGYGVDIRGNRSSSTGFYGGAKTISEAHYRLAPASGNDGVQCSEAACYFIVDGFQIEVDGAFRSGIDPGTGGNSRVNRLRNNRIRESGTAGYSGIGTGNGSTSWGDSIIENNLISGFQWQLECRASIHFRNDLGLYHNTCAGRNMASSRAILVTGSAGSSPSMTLEVKGNACGGNTQDLEDSWTGTSASVYADNVFEDAAGTTDEVSMGTVDDAWVTPATGIASAADKRFGLFDPRPGGSLVGVVNPCPVSTDLRGNARPANATAGCFELVDAHADISPRSVTTGASAGSTTYTVDKPAGAVEGDVLVAIFEFTDNGFINITAPAGWIEVEQTGDSFQSTTCFYKELSAGEPSSYNFTLNSSQSGQWSVVCYASCEVDVFDGLYTNGSSPTTAPSIITTQPDTLLVAAFGGFVGSGPYFDAPGGFTPRVQSTNISSAKGCIVTDKVQSSSGATGDSIALANKTGLRGAGFHVALKVVSGNEGTVSESGSAVDTQSAVATMGATAAESGSAAETASAAMVAPVTRAESGSAADSPAAIATFVGAVAESGSAVESTDATLGGLEGSVAESGSAVDTPAATMVAAKAVAETGSAADTSTAARVVPAISAEAGSAADSQSAVAAFPAIVSETGAAVDTSNGFVGSVVNETMSAVETTNATVLHSAAVAETLNAQDVPAATAILGVSIAEAAAVVDSPQVTWTGFASVLEASPAADSISATVGVIPTFLAGPRRRHVAAGVSQTSHVAPGAGDARLGQPTVDDA